MRNIPLIERLLLLLVLLCSTHFVSAQISYGGTPPSFNYKQSTTDIDTREVYLPFTRADLIANDNLNAHASDPLPITRNIPLALTMENAGTWSTLPSGEQVWQLCISAPDAIATMLYYKEFYLPQGSKLYIYNRDRTQVLGAYTHDTHPSGDRFATELVAGDEVVLEYVAPTTPATSDQPRITIEEIGYGYNGIEVRSTGWGSSSSCMVDVICEEGDTWQREARSVSRLIVKVGSGSYLCTGSMMNNTAQDKKPLLLTAHHCSDINGVQSSAEDMKQWIFHFNYQKQGCQSDESESSSIQSMVGCSCLTDIPLARGTDALLLLLNKEIPASYQVYYNGWDRSTRAPQRGVGIHHPNGDAKKISTYTSPAETYTFRDSYNTGLFGGSWNVIFAATANGHAVTAGGSSGSPLYNERKLLVGTLTGGDSFCTNLLGSNIYGKFALQWGNSDSDPMQRLDLHLDPLGVGAMRLTGLDSNASDPLSIQVGEEVKHLVAIDGVYTYLSDCGVDRVEIAIVAEATQTVTIDGEVGRVIDCSPQDTPQHYNVVIGERSYPLEVKQLSSNLLMRRWDNVITVINNPENNGGNTFNIVNWYCNDQVMEGEHNLYIVVEEEHKNDLFKAELETQSGVLLYTCPVTRGELTTLTSVTELPSEDTALLQLATQSIAAGEPIPVVVNLAPHQEPATLSLFSSKGELLQRLTPTAGYNTLAAPSGAGLYIVTLTTADGERESLKVVIP